VALQNGSDEELLDISSSPSVLSVVLNEGGICGKQGERRNAYMGLVGKPERKGPRGRHRNRGKIILKCILKNS
jgi:hypothetical protein